MSGGALDISYTGYETDRYRKIKAIQADEWYLRDVGVPFIASRRVRAAVIRLRDEAAENGC